MIDYVADAIAIIALLLSGVALYQSKQRDRINHEFELFRETYQDHLVVKLPAARSMISVTQSGLVTGTDDFINELNAIRKDSLYFQYANSTFFEDLKKKLWHLEDYLTLLPNPLVGEERLKFEDTVQRGVRDIYSCITNRF